MADDTGAVVPEEEKRDAKSAGSDRSNASREGGARSKAGSHAKLTGSSEKLDSRDGNGNGAASRGPSKENLDVNAPEDGVNEQSGADSKEDGGNESHENEDGSGAAGDIDGESGNKEHGGSGSGGDGDGDGGGGGDAEDDDSDGGGGDGGEGSDDDDDDSDSEDGEVTASRANLDNGLDSLAIAMENSMQEIIARSAATSLSELAQNVAGSKAALNADGNNSSSSSSSSSGGGNNGVNKESGLSAIQDDDLCGSFNRHLMSPPPSSSFSANSPSAAATAHSSSSTSSSSSNTSSSTSTSSSKSKSAQSSLSSSVALAAGFPFVHYGDDEKEDEQFLRIGMSLSRPSSASLAAKITTSNRRAAERDEYDIPTPILRPSSPELGGGRQGDQGIHASQYGGLSGDGTSKSRHSSTARLEAGDGGDGESRRRKSYVSSSVRSLNASSQSRLASFSSDPRNPGRGENNDDQESDNETDLKEVFDRDSLIAKIRAHNEERQRMERRNLILQNRLSDHFRRKRTDESREGEKSATDQEQRYMNCMLALDELRKEYESILLNNTQTTEEVKTRLEKKHLKSLKMTEEFSRYKRQIALAAENSRTGKPIPPKLVEQLESTAQKKEMDVSAARLENIKLRNKLRRHEQLLRQKEELADGLHLIDFEQLKIENQTYNEKIEERNEELLKLRKKIMNTVQVLTHVKEKLQFVQAENLELKKVVRKVEEDVTSKRDLLARSKQERDQLRTDNVKLRRKSGLLANELLLRDFEERKDEGIEYHEKLEELKDRHGSLSSTFVAYKRKIQKAQLIS